MLPHEHQLLVQYGYAGLFVLLMLGIVGLPVPDDTLVTAAGFLVRNGTLQTAPVFVAAVMGSACGITLSYVVGWTLGYGVLHRFGGWLHLTEARLERFHRWYGKTGRWTLVFGYFVPGLRHVVAIGAGASRLSWGAFAVFAYSGAILWVATFLCAGYLLGGEWEHAGPRLRILMVALTTGMAAAVVLAILLGWLRYQRARQRACGGGT